MIISERKNTFGDESGFKMQLDEITFNRIDLRWGSYVNPNERTMIFHSDKPAVISHFRMYDPSGIKSKQGVSEKQFVVYREPSVPYDYRVAPTNNQTRSFFELTMSDDFFNTLFTDESDFLIRFHNTPFKQTPAFDFVEQMTPAMYNVINDMQHSPYAGHLKGVYLEAKAIELFLLQVKQFESGSSIKKSTLKPRDIECLYEVKRYMEIHYDQPCSIIDLARSVGINQMKLKAGFKELFNTTVFAFLSDLRMAKAKQLLLDEKLFVGEVSDRIGYKHPHHFTAAFKRKFGILPSDLKK